MDLTSLRVEELKDLFEHYMTKDRFYQQCNIFTCQKEFKTDIIYDQILKLIYYST